MKITERHLKQVIVKQNQNRTMAKNVIYLNSEAYNIGYADGQRDQRKKDIEKAWKWILWMLDTQSVTQDFIEESHIRFIKAMEDEQ